MIQIIVALLQFGDYKQNAEELSGQFEGDIILNPEQAAHIFGDDNDELRNGLIAEKYRWKNNTIPYTLSNSFTVEQKAYIVKGLKNLEAISCLKFVPRQNEIDYIDVLVRFSKEILSVFIVHIIWYCTVY